mgnify:CR=1 FL=1
MNIDALALEAEALIPVGDTVGIEIKMGGVLVAEAGEVETASGSKTRNYFSMNGYADSPEAKAHSEWMDFWWDYAFSIELSNEPDFSWTNNELEEKYSIIYAAYDRVMMDKLLQIQEKYQIRLHTEQVRIPTEELFYKISGVQPFIAADDFYFYLKKNLRGWQNVCF